MPAATAAALRRSIVPSATASAAASPRKSPVPMMTRARSGPLCGKR